MEDLGRVFITSFLHVRLRPESFFDIDTHSDVTRSRLAAT